MCQRLGSKATISRSHFILALAWYNLMAMPPLARVVKLDRHGLTKDLKQCCVLSLIRS